MTNKRTLIMVASIFVAVAIFGGLGCYLLGGTAHVGSGSSFNPIAREFGGTVTVNLEPNRKLVNISWKTDNSLWVLTRKMRDGEEAEEYEYREDSSFGIIEGTVKIIEHKAIK